MLQQVGHSDGGVQLPRLVGGFGSLAVIPRDVQEPAVLRRGGAVVLVYNERAVGFVCAF